jgi:hypothetical protein
MKSPFKAPLPLAAAATFLFLGGRLAFAPGLWPLAALACVIIAGGLVLDRDAQLSGEAKAEQMRDLWRARDRS